MTIHQYVDNNMSPSNIIKSHMKLTKIALIYLEREGFVPSNLIWTIQSGIIFYPPKKQNES